MTSLVCCTLGHTHYLARVHVSLCEMNRLSLSSFYCEMVYLRRLLWSLPPDQTTLVLSLQADYEVEYE